MPHRACQGPAGALMRRALPRVRRAALVALLITVGSSGSAAPIRPSQVLESPAFELFVRQADKVCPHRAVRFVSPAELSWYEEGFDGRLPKTTKNRLEARDDGASRCAGRNGLSCPATSYLKALERNHLMARFARFVCATDAPR